jgi:hypothetical protein
MTAQVGKHYVGRYHSAFAVWQWDSVDENGGTSAHKVQMFWEYEEAVREMYRLNGWKQPEKMYRKY